MTPDEINRATTALVEATKKEAVASGAQVEDNQALLAPGLNTGSNEVGGYNYARNVAPTVAPLTAEIVTGAKQAILKQALKDAQYAADVNLDNAEYAMQDRQRAYQVEQAKRNRERRLKAEREAAAVAQAQIAALRGGTGSGISDVTTEPTGKQKTIRQFYQEKANAGDANAKVAIQYAGDDNRYDGPVRSQAEIAALRAAGVQGNYYFNPPSASKIPIYNPNNTFKIANPLRF